MEITIIIIIIISDVGKMLRGMKVFSCRAMRINIKERLYVRIAMPAALYGAEAWSIAVIKKCNYIFIISE